MSWAICDECEQVIVDLDMKEYLCENCISKLRKQFDVATRAFAQITGPSISRNTPKEVLAIKDIIWSAQEEIRKIGAGK